SGLFYRGETHILSAVTLGAPGDVQLVEGMEVQTKKRFMHHYNFPPFSTGDVGRMGSPGRREIGHGALAERALEPMLPPKEQFPYTVRIVSEALSSNGSTSMGSVCASTLAMMDAGIPIKKPVAGIAMGLMVKDENNFKVLTDIQGPEDHHGDMDFKAAGTKDGITAIQMYVKVEGVTVKMLAKVLQDAKKARMHILDVMLKTIPEPRSELPKHAPRIIVFNIDPDRIRDVIGPGGKTINKIIDATGAEIDIEQDGSIFITADSADQANDALDQIKLITKEFAVGEKTVGQVTRIFEFGAMVEIAPKKEGLIHISELAPWRVNKVTDVVNIGDEVPVQVIGVDDQGRINLSLKAVKTIEKPEGYVEEDRPSGGFRPRHDGGGRGGFGGGHRGGPQRGGFRR
ncbi:MAG: polyribonucleotide nucleotidyltransferase, partial [Patescibacteria group bacterium]